MLFTLKTSHFYINSQNNSSFHEDSPIETTNSGHITNITHQMALEHQERLLAARQHDHLITLASGHFAQSQHIIVQTHCRDSNWEHDYVLKRFGHTDSETLQSFGLLNQHSVSAHATQITKQVQIIIKTEQSVTASQMRQAGINAPL